MQPTCNIHATGVCHEDRCHAMQTECLVAYTTLMRGAQHHHAVRLVVSAGLHRRRLRCIGQLCKCAGVLSLSCFIISSANTLPSHYQPCFSYQHRPALWTCAWTCAMRAGMPCSAALGDGAQHTCTLAFVCRVPVTVRLACVHACLRSRTRTRKFAPCACAGAHAVFRDGAKQLGLARGLGLTLVKEEPQPHDEQQRQGYHTQLPTAIGLSHTAATTTAVHPSENRHCTPGACTCTCGVRLSRPKMWLTSSGPPDLGAK